MRRPSVIAIGEAVHTAVEQMLKKGARMSNKRRRTPAEEEALRLRVETGARERLDFGKKTVRALTDEDAGYMAGEDVGGTAGGEWHEHPEAWQQLGSMGSSLTGYSVIEEIREDRMLGKLRPFVEGEPIGAIHYHECKPAPPLRTPEQIKEEEREALRERQKRNDRTLAKLARRYR